MPDVFDQIEQSQSPQTQPQAVAQAGAAAQGDVFDQLEANGGDDAAVIKAQATAPTLPPAEEASQTRQMLVAGLTGMPTPNMTAEDRQSFEKGKAAGAISVPIVAAGTAGAAASGELAGAAEKVLQISEQALEHLAENYPQLTKLATKLGYGAGAAGAYKLLNKLGIH